MYRCVIPHFNNNNTVFNVSRCSMLMYMLVCHLDLILNPLNMHLAMRQWQTSPRQNCNVNRNRILLYNHSNTLFPYMSKLALGKTWNGMEWIGMEWNGLDWIGLEWNGILSEHFLFISNLSPINPTAPPPDSNP